MAVSRVRTHGLLNKWPVYMDVNQWHFNQVSGSGDDAPVSSPGEFVYVQPERERIVQGFTKALGLAVPRIEFWPRPEYCYESIPVHYSTFHRLHKLATKYRYVDAIGRRGLTVIQAAASVAYDNPDDPTDVDNRATITVALPAEVTDPHEVQVFFRAADSLGEAGAEVWRIEPLDVTITGATATITGHRSLFVLPALWRQPYRSPNYNDASKNVGDVNDPAAFVTTVDVYRVYPDTTDAISIRCGPAGCSPLELDTVAGEGYVYDGEAGLIGIDRAECYSCGPRWQCIVDVWYRAGYPLDPATGQMDAQLEQAFIQLANAKMPLKLTSGDLGTEVWFRDSRVYGQAELLDEDRKNPFGIEYGSVDAWRTLKNFRRAASMRALR